VSGYRRIDPVERAHLRDERGFSPPVHRYAVPPELDDLVCRFWVPVWSLPPGESTVQRVLQYPVCQLVVGSDRAAVTGPTTGLATQHLSGSGWVVGAMLQPAAGSMLLGGPVSAATNEVVPLETSALTGVDELVAGVRRLVGPAPADHARHQQACALLGRALLDLGPVDEEGLLVNRVVRHVEREPGVVRVSQVCAAFGLSERTLQRLLARRVGLSPKWLIQRRRLHEAAERLRSGALSGRHGALADVAADLGYADQAHFTRDFRAVTGTTPGAFAAEPRPAD